MTLGQALSPLAHALVRHFNEQDFDYKPKRGKGVGNVRTWPERLKGYRWRGSDCPFADSALISQLEVDLGDASRQLKFETEWSGETERKVLAGTVALFCWGGVLRGKGHNPPCLEDIKAVMRTATEREDRFKAPLDSAWTKLAAISTAWLANDGEQHPQIIYDSRVSVSLLRAIDAVCAQDASLHIARDQLKARGLGYVIGRGGNRMKEREIIIANRWPRGYKKWQSQFAASELVAEMVKVLNSVHTIGRMPAANGKSLAWTTRGVEQVLFMDGY